MVSGLISRAIILLFGTLYPAYASYKAVKTKNVKEYVKWMMYWIVFAFFTCAETICDIFVSWIPFYYEMKIVFVLWLLSPATKGSSILYRKFVHPQLTKREKEIDSYIAKASDQGYSALVSLGTKGFSYATNIVLSTAIKGQSKIADHLRKSYSLNDLSQDDTQKFHHQDSEVTETEDEIDNYDSDEKPAPDNRLIEESYRSEMREKDIDDDGEGGKMRRRRSHRTKESIDLQPVEEEDDEVNRKTKAKKTYSHKEIMVY